MVTGRKPLKMAIRTILKKLALKFKIVIIRSIIIMMKVCGISPNLFSAYYLPHLLQQRRINDHLLLVEEAIPKINYFIQYLPDRYFYNFRIYKKTTDFFSYLDLPKYIAGNYDNNIGDISRFFLINLCIDCLIDENIKGDIAELGVYRGNSAFLLAKFARRIDRICYLFDTFEGFDPRDKKGVDVNLPESFFADTSLETAKKIIGERNTVYVKGFFPDSLGQINEISDLALVHLDCDLEAPFISSLNYFYPRIKKGGFLIMHDYSSLFWLGAKKAIDEFFADKPEFVVPLPDKSGTCIIRKTS